VTASTKAVTTTFWAATKSLRLMQKAMYEATFAPDFVCPLPSVDKFRWAVHVVGMRRHHFLECVTGGGGAFGAMAAIAEAVSMY
jgi:hypothetical protein